MERKAKGHVKPTRSNSSNRWMHEHVTDPFVQQAKKLGYRSRAAFKIIEIDEKYKLFRRGMTVVDLGAAPGGWSQIAAPKVGAVNAVAAGKGPAATGAATKTAQPDAVAGNALAAAAATATVAAEPVRLVKGSAAGQVIAIDLLAMQGLPGVQFIQADFTSDAGLAAVITALGKNAKAKGKADLVLSDMSPNITGIGISDQAKSIYLCELGLDFAAKFLQPNGVFVVKTFQGVGFTEFLKAVRATFKEVKTAKPKSSRNRSSEMYLVARGLKENLPAISQSRLQGGVKA